MYIYIGDKNTMKVNFGDTVPLSTLDWPGKATMTIFLRGCVFNCPYCQNHELLEENNYIELKEITKKIKESIKYIDGVIFSGGEPMMQAEAVKELAKYCKQSNLLVGIHTNGYYPDEVNKLLNKNYLDFVSMDIKAPLNNEKKYSEVTDTDVDLSKIKQTLNNLRESKVEIELTTTLFRNKIDLKEIKEIIKFLEKEKYVLQQGRTENAYKEEYKKLNTLSRSELIDKAKKVDYENIYVRTKERGDVEV